VHRFVRQDQQNGGTHITPVDTSTAAAFRPAASASSAAFASVIVWTVRVTTRLCLAACLIPATFRPALKLLERVSISVSHRSLLNLDDTITIYRDTLNCNTGHVSISSVDACE